MPAAPSTDNYTLGKGIVYFDKIDANGEYAGERDLGNAVVFTLSSAIEKLDHFNNRSGLRAKDKTVVTEITPSVAFTLDEINVDNVALMFMADTVAVTQTADDALTYTIDVSAMTDSKITGGLYLDVGAYRNIGVYTLTWDSGVGGVPLRGETITGTSGATAVILNVVTGSTTAAGTAYVKSIGGTPPFVEDESVTTTTLTAANLNHPAGTTGLDATSGLVFDVTQVAISDSATGATVSTKTTDFVVDSATGRVKIVAGGALEDETEDYVVEFAVLADSYTTIRGFNETSIEGRLRFVSDNPEGENREVFIHRLDLTPEGDVAMIGEEWQILPFVGEILKDEENNPDSPYMDITADI
jgi:hypothetical protein